MALFEGKEPELVRQVRKLIKRELGSGVSIEFDPDSDTIVAGSHQMRLGNIRRVWDQLDKRDRAEWLHNTIADMVSASPIPDVLTDVSSLRVGLRSGSFIEATRLSALRGGQEPILPARRQLIPDLFELLLWDLPTSMSLVTEERLAEWSRSLDELLAIGRANVAAMPRVGFAAFDNRVFHLVNGDDYDSSRLLIDEALDELPVSGDLVGVIPTRNMLVIASVDDQEAVRIACEYALQDHDDVSIFNHPLVRRNGEWSPLMLNQGHAAYKPWRTLVRVEQAQAANNVQELLQSIVGEEIFVGSIGLRENPITGNQETVAAWTEGIPILLPEVDMLAFPREDQSIPMVQAPWEAVVETVGDLMQPTEHYPTRWRVESFPTEAQFASMTR